MAHARALTADHVRRLRLRSQRLVGPAASALEAVRAMFGAQAQDAPAGALSVRTRLDPATRPTADGIENARVHDRTLVRTSLMRGTLHLVATDDLPLLLPLCGAEYVKALAGRRADLGLDPDTAARGLRLLDALLAEHGALTRDALRAHLAPLGIPVEGQSLAHLLYLASGHRLICHGPGHGRDQTIVRLADWLPRPIVMALAEPPPRAEALERLVRRYLEAFAPATPEDCAAWSGLRISEIRAGFAAIEDDLLEIDTEGRRRYLLSSQREWLDQPFTGSPNVRLLAAFDTLLMGYRVHGGTRDLTLEARYEKHVLPGGGMLRPTVLVDGQIRAIWRAERRGRALAVTISPFEPLPSRLERAMESEAQDVARFLGLEGAILA